MSIQIFLALMNMSTLLGLDRREIKRIIKMDRQLRQRRDSAANRHDAALARYPMRVGDTLG